MKIRLSEDLKPWKEGYIENFRKGGLILHVSAGFYLGDLCTNAEFFQSDKPISTRDQAYCSLQWATSRHLEVHSEWTRDNAGSIWTFYYVEVPDDEIGAFLGVPIEVIDYAVLKPRFRYGGKGAYSAQTIKELDAALEKYASEIEQLREAAAA